MGKVVLEVLRNGVVVGREDIADDGGQRIFEGIEGRVEAVLSCGSSSVSLHPQIRGDRWMVLIRLGSAENVGLVDETRPRSALMTFVYGGDHMPESAQWGVPRERVATVVQQFLAGRLEIEALGLLSVYRASGPDVTLGGRALAQRALGFGKVR